MAKKETIGGVPRNVLGMLGDLMSKLQHGAITSRELELFLKKRNPFKVVVVSDVDEFLQDWKNFYSDVFSLEKDFSDLKVPPRVDGFDRLLIMAEGMMPNVLFEKIKELMPAWKYMDDLDVIKSDRSADQDYAIWVRDRIEADEELKNKSADDLKKEGIPGITLEERLLYELKYFIETSGGHLDLSNWTLCAGSLVPVGGVPSVYWDDGRLGVDWCDPDESADDLRARAVVS